MKYWIRMKERRYNPMSRLFKIIGLALAVHFIVKTVHNELNRQ